MKLLAQSQDGSILCFASETQLKFFTSRFLELYATDTSGIITAGCFHPQKFEIFLKMRGVFSSFVVIFDLVSKKYRMLEEHDINIPQEPWLPPSMGIMPTLTSSMMPTLPGGGVMGRGEGILHGIMPGIL